MVAPDQPLVFTDLHSGLYTRWEMQVDASRWSSSPYEFNIYFTRFMCVAAGDLDPTAVWGGQDLSIEFSAMI